MSDVPVSHQHSAKLEGMLHLPMIINISNKYESPQASVCTLSLSENTTTLIELLGKDKRELAEELIWLRETSRATFQEYDNEVEYLQRQCASCIDTEVKLNAQLTDSRANEEVWRLRCLAAEELRDAMPCEHDESHADNLPRPLSLVCLEDVNKRFSQEISNDVQMLSKKKTLQNLRDNLRDKIWSWSNGNLLHQEEDAITSNTSIHSCSNKHPSGINEGWDKVNTMMNEVLSQSISPLHTEKLYDNNTTNLSKEYHVIKRIELNTDEISKESRSYLSCNVCSQEDLSLIISSRDQAIVSLEQTIQHQLENMQDMDAEAVCLIEAQGIMEKSLTSLHKQREEHANGLIKSLRGKLKANEMSTKEHNEALLSCKLYIQELTCELKRLLSTIKRAEDDGFIVDSNTLNK